MLPRLILATFAFLQTGNAIAQDIPARFLEVRKDMTADEVLKKLNNQKPDRICRQILYRRHLEQWVYEEFHFRIEFDCHPGEVQRVARIIRARDH